MNKTENLNTTAFIYVSWTTWFWRATGCAHLYTISSQYEWRLTTSPFCWAERDSRKEKTPPPTDTSRHRPDFASPPQNDPRGCIMRTPFVVRPSISRFSCHFVAFSCKEQFEVMHTHYSVGDAAFCSHTQIHRYSTGLSEDSSIQSTIFTTCFSKVPLNITLRHYHDVSKLVFSFNVFQTEILCVRECIQKFPDWVDNQTNTRWEATQRIMAAKLIILTHKIAIQLHLVAESCTICSSRSRRPVRKLLDTPSYDHPPQ
jgi:hypothetical protein